MTVKFDRVDLTNCDREPIHMLGHVQSFGALIAVNADWLISHHSENLGEILNQDIGQVVGRPLSDVFAEDFIDKLRDQLDCMAGQDSVSRLFNVDPTDSGKFYQIALHCSGSRTIVEIEPRLGGASLDEMAAIRTVSDRLSGHDSVEALCDTAVRELRNLVGFDRVMAYRFHRDGSGDVIAETRRNDLESFLSLRYPANDIPKQARELYLRNTIRIIADVDDATSPILPREVLDGKPLDLSLSTLRAVSPIHIEYLKNMGVGASMSISIIVDGKLWGLFACHHYSPRVLPYSVRTAAEMFGQLFSLSLDQTMTRISRALHGDGRKLHDQLMTRIASGTPLVAGLPTLGPIVNKVIPHDGVSAFVDDVYRATGSAPTEEEFLKLVPSLNGGEAGRVVATDALAEQLSAAQAFADRAAGALIIPVSRRPRDYFILWRRELTQVVKWAGKPNKAYTEGPNGPRLSPRESFAEWQETVRGTSEDWTDDELQIAESIRVTLLEVILRMTDDAMEERARHQEQQELLIAELNHRVRNILNLIKSLIKQSQTDATDIASFSEVIGGRIGALAAAHDNITKGNWSPASVHELIRTEADAYVGNSADRLNVTGQDRLISPEAYTVLALVLHEMMTNSAKYGALCDSRGSLDIEINLDAEGDLQLCWRERGGPPVKAPTRRGFGTTIIERSIPFELQGSTSLRYEVRGVEADFCIPARFVAENSDASASEQVKDAKANLAHNEKSASEGQEVSVPEHILLVEDSMLIALDTEDSLRKLGVKTVSVASDVMGALDRIDKDTPAMAILDFNLGSETSEPVARELNKRSIPFFLATGYGEMGDKLSELGAAGLLTKPYGEAELKKLLASYHPA